MPQIMYERVRAQMGERGGGDKGRVNGFLSTLDRKPRFLRSCRSCDARHILRDRYFSWQTTDRRQQGTTLPPMAVYAPFDLF